MFNLLLASRSIIEYSIHVIRYVSLFVFLPVVTTIDKFIKED